MAEISVQGIRKGQVKGKQQGGNDELLPIFWERIRKLMYMKSDKIYKAMQSRFERCGIEIWNLKQSCYTAFLEAVRGYKANDDLKFTAYLSYPFRNTVNNLIGVRTKTKQNEPLNNCTSLQVPVSHRNADNMRIDLKWLEKNGVRLIAVNDGTDIASKNYSKLITTVKAATTENFT